MISRVLLFFLAFFSLSVSLPGAPRGQQAPGEVKQGFAASSMPSSEPRAVFSQTLFEFGEVISGDVVEHDFDFTNQGSSPLMIEKVTMTPPLLVTQMPRGLAPGAQGRIHFRLDTANLQGNFEGTILVYLNDPALSQVRLGFEGRVVPAIELSPRPAFFVAGQRGKESRAGIEIVNQESEPLRIEKIEEANERFTTQLETLNPGQLFRLTLILKPYGPIGRATGTILIRTSSKRMPILNVGANTYLYERVHTFPDVVDFGTLSLTDAGRVGMILMIHQEGGTDFKVQLNSDIPGLSFECERGPQGDRYEVKITLVSGKMRLGPIQGSIIIDTNDSEFPRVIVPVTGQFVLGTPRLSSSATRRND